LFLVQKNKMKKIYLREVITFGSSVSTTLTIFEGDIEKDREYWEKYQGAISVRYFELKEVK